MSLLLNKASSYNEARKLAFQRPRERFCLEANIEGEHWHEIGSNVFE